MHLGEKRMDSESNGSNMSVLTQGIRLGFRFFAIIAVITLPINILIAWLGEKSVSAYFTTEFVVAMLTSPLIWGALIFSVLLFVIGGFVNAFRK
ncbi:hypothetical protein QFX18_19305 [Saccharophagus degradans]|uniref:hypothetical protein n=1 Tax=Saccharophagus degradans TaxID=86304 RepID=UPI0024781EB7|nr:hypothetical protein [Saccharophagus degradans]WGO98158.1 hypothetical protein QFX18_19305 [Saccharophagus degradans]